MDESKAWYTSKTLWVNAVALVAIIVQGFTGFVVGLETQTVILGAINLILRMITKSSITWK